VRHPRLFEVGQASACPCAAAACNASSRPFCMTVARGYFGWTPRARPATFHLQPTSPLLVQRASRFVNRRILRRFGLQVVRPEVLHGPADLVGVLPWSRRLSVMETLYDRIRDVPGAVVECGVYYGSGLLLHLHMTQMGQARPIWGFDSFAGHSAAHSKDLTSPEATRLGDSFAVHEDDAWKSLRLGTLLSTEELKARITLVCGWMQDTLPVHASRIGPVALVQLDPDYYEPCAAALRSLWLVLSRGGIIYIGRLENPQHPGKGHALREFLRERSPDDFDLTPENGDFGGYLTKR
jgi:hypothetical protein